ncbi:MAG: hypothetical protein EB039_09540 [Proteobacteria bacterium]|nr:hypothetical protein [Pseudomonadota bacterium]
MACRRRYTGSGVISSRNRRSSISASSQLTRHRSGNLQLARTRGGCASTSVRAVKQRHYPKISLRPNADATVP